VVRVCPVAHSGARPAPERTSARPCEKVTGGLGAGSQPEVGRAAAEEAIDVICDQGIRSTRTAGRQRQASRWQTLSIRSPGIEKGLQLPIVRF
jgi:hypothetical protein